VFERMAELERQLEEAQVKAAKYDHRREKSREYDRRWRQKNPDEVRTRTRERMAAHRARKRQADS